jgi:hypothetical protein
MRGFPLFCKRTILRGVTIFISGVKEFVFIANAITGLGSCAGSGIHNLSGLAATFILFYLYFSIYPLAAEL